MNSVVAEALTNAHTFLVVGPNHTGDDLYRFENRPTSKGEFYVRQVIGSVNYRTGGDVNDWLHMWLNYQIEHHLFPDIPMRTCQRVQPRVKALCERFGVPYLQEPVTRRFGKMLDVFVGRTSMRKAPPRPRVRNTPRAAPNVVATPVRG
jgi:fatty acid desaturase